MQVAIDGPAAAGKSTVARLVAEKLGGIYINTGDMYRALTWIALQRGVDPETAPERVAAMLDNLRLDYRLADGAAPVLALDGHPLEPAAVRSPAVAAKVSFTARIPPVRDWLVERQRRAGQLGLVVMEGRDIGTVVFPGAKYKFFIEASPMVRARRRLAQPGEVVDSATLESVAAEIARRDELDRNRRISPLRPAADAEVIDTDHLTAAEVADLIVERVYVGESQCPSHTRHI